MTWMKRFLVSAAGVMVVWLSGLAGAVEAGQTMQTFPADQPVRQARTSWRVVWDITRHGGRSEILYIKEAYFRRSPQEPEIKVLGDCRLAEIFVPYANGTRIYDISGHNFNLEPLTSKDLGPTCVAPPLLYNRDGAVSETGLVAHEVHDSHLRWKDAHGRSLRGQEMHLWSVLDGSNYRYIMLYIFRDDGQVSFRLGATAHNLFSKNDDGTTHLHAGCWRLNVELGKASQNYIQLARFLSKPGQPPRNVVEPFNNNREGGMVWKAEEFPRLRIESRVRFNGHNPPSKMGYELIAHRQGNPRLYGPGEEFTHRDIWVTRQDPQQAEIHYRDVPKYANNETLNGPAIIWHQAAVLHSPRDEDFGRNGYSSNEGVAITTWAGFDLRPRNFFASTPLYPNDANGGR